MNRFLAVLFFVVAVSAQGPPPQTGCCAPAPVIIQLSCGDGGSPHQTAPAPAGPPAPPAGAGPGEQAESAFDQLFGPGTGLDDMEYLMNMCEFDDHGVPSSHPPGGFPQGFRVEIDAEGNPSPIAPEGFPGPSPQWDGTPGSLGFPMPARGTAHFNMLMCWPFAVPAIGGVGR